MNKAMLLKQYMFNNKKKSGRLPSAYQEVEYIESTGTQIIDTLYKPNQNTKLIMDCYAGVDEPISVVDSGWTINSFGISSAYFLFGNGNYYPYSSVTFPERHLFELSKDGGYVDGVKKVSVPSTSFSCDYSLTILGNHRNGEYSPNGKVEKIYSYKLYDNGTKVRDFIPCYRKSDNEVGLYDIVNDQFYTNQGTGSFLCGRPLVNIDGYEQLDYIESSGTQYIDTGIYQNSSARKYIIETSFNTIDTPSYIIRGNYDYIAETFQIDDKGNYYIGYCGSEKGVAGAVANEKNSFECYFSNGNQYLKKNGTTIISMSKAYSSSYSYKIMIFKGSVVGTWAKAKLYHLSIYSNDTIIRDYIPMRRLYDNELGLYDLVNNVFYTNQGSGSFIAGEVLKA